MSESAKEQNAAPRPSVGEESSSALNPENSTSRATTTSPPLTAAEERHVVQRQMIEDLIEGMNEQVFCAMKFAQKIDDLKDNPKIASSCRTVLFLAIFLVSGYMSGLLQLLQYIAKRFYVDQDEEAGE